MKIEEKTTTTATETYCIMFWASIILDFCFWLIRFFLISLNVASLWLFLCLVCAPAVLMLVLVLESVFNTTSTIFNWEHWCKPTNNNNNHNHNSRWKCCCLLHHHHSCESQSTCTIFKLNKKARAEARERETKDEKYKPKDWMEEKFRNF